jgi:hypothetical protein
MKRAFIILLLSLAAPLYCFAGGDVVIDKDNCTITKDGKTFNLYGDIQIVESYPDLRVQIVNSYPDMKIQIVSSYPTECGLVKIVDSYPILRVQIVDSNPDLKVQIVDHYPGID